MKQYLLRVFQKISNSLIVSVKYYLYLYRKPPMDPSRANSGVKLKKIRCEVTKNI